MHISEPAEYVILGLLQTRPMYGYEMFQQFEHGAPGQIVHLEMSQMYAFLKKLERLHYVEAQSSFAKSFSPHVTRSQYVFFLVIAACRETA
jgi:DNA-binding PadR family transcriptional regulator